jgi:hydroxymethylglutaryl-CoA reductase (NADPH)
MHGTFAILFINMRKLGSRFWLGASVLVSGTFAFVLALLTTYLSGYSVNPILLSEALPFLVITVGFEKPFILTRAVFSNPAIAPMRPSTSSSAADDGTSYLDVRSNGASKQARGVRWGAPMSSKDIVVSGVEKAGPQIARDYAIEIAVLVAGALSGVGGLREFCALAALILAYDCVFLFVFYVAVLAVMVEVSLYLSSPLRYDQPLNATQRYTG